MKQLLILEIRVEKKKKIFGSFQKQNKTKKLKSSKDPKYYGLHDPKTVA